MLRADIALECKAWDDLSALEQAQCIYSDMHKDAYGFRPRHDTSSWTLGDFEQEFAVMQAQIKQDLDHEAREQAQAISRFEQHVTNTICMGARDRDTALRWIMDASDANGDWQYFCYLNGLPYGYFKQAA